MRVPPSADIERLGPIIAAAKIQEETLRQQTWRLSDAERARLGQLGDLAPKDWAGFAVSIRPHLLLAYRDRDITFRRLIELARNVSLGARPQVRLTFIGDTAERALQIRRSERGRPRIPPVALLHAALDLVLDREALEREQGSGRRFWDGRDTESIIHDSAKLLELLQLFRRPISPARLHRFYLKRQAVRGVGRKRGRPPKG